jgi:hypothetical protein
MGHDFSLWKTAFFDYIKQNFPDYYNDFSDGAVGTMLVELYSYLASRQSHMLSLAYQEMDLDSASLDSLYMIAKKQGVYIPPSRPASVFLDFSVVVPARGDAPDLDYMPVILRGAQAAGSGQVFEAEEDVDFLSPLSQRGIPNRFITPNYSSSSQLISYTITKRVPAKNGKSFFFSKSITSADSAPFFEVTLPQADITDVTDVITVRGGSPSQTPSLRQIYDRDLRWEQVSNLLEDKKFTEVFDISANVGGVRRGRYLPISKRYVTYTDKRGFTTIVFGDSPEPVSLDGETPPLFGYYPAPGSALFVKYRVGGGGRANVGRGVLNSLGEVNMSINGPNASVNSRVRASLSVTNPTPASGGKNRPSEEEIRSMIKKALATKKNAVTISDYEALIYQMPPRFGAPFRHSVTVKDNKINIFILSLNEFGNLTPNISELLAENIKEYLSPFRMINDYVEITPAEVVNFTLQIDVSIDRGFFRDTITSEIKEKIGAFLSKERIFIGQPISVSDISRAVSEIEGVRSVRRISFYKPMSGDYSSIQGASPISDVSLGLYDTSNGVFMVYESQAAELKNPSSDIKINIL